MCICPSMPLICKQIINDSLPNPTTRRGRPDDQRAKTGADEADDVSHLRTGHGDLEVKRHGHDDITG